MVNASNPPAAARALNAQLAGLMGAASGGDGSDATVSDTPFGLISSLAMNCTDVPSVYMKTVAEVTRKLYCGYYQSRCAGGSGPQQLSAAYDWRDTDAVK